MKKYAIPTGNTTVEINTDDIPDYTAQNMAQILLDAVHKVYMDPAVQAEYQKWKAQRRLEDTERL